MIIPNVIKNYNKSKINAIVIQENQLIEAGDILLDDYCKDAVNDSYKVKCNIYYQQLEQSIASQISTEKDYKYIRCRNCRSPLSCFLFRLAGRGTEHRCSGKGTFYHREWFQECSCRHIHKHDRREFLWQELELWAHGRTCANV